MKTPQLRDNENIIVLNDGNVKRISLFRFCLSIAAFTLFVFGFPLLALYPIPTNVWDVIDGLSYKFWIVVTLVLSILFGYWALIGRKK